MPSVQSAQAPAVVPTSHTVQPAGFEVVVLSVQTVHEPAVVVPSEHALQTPSVPVPSVHVTHASMKALPPQQLG